MDTQKLRQRILDLAIRGKLVPQDPNDEPASVLLDRIRAEKERLIAEGKIKRPKAKKSTDKSHYQQFTPPFDIPDSWEWVKLEDISYAVLGKMLDKSKNKGINHPYLRNINVRWFEFDLSDLLEMPFENQEADRYSIKHGDLVICEGGEPGRCAVWDKTEPIMFQKALHRVRFFGGINSCFISNIIHLYCLNGFITKYFTGSGIKHLTGESLANILIPMPPIEEQKRVLKSICSFDCIIQQINVNKNFLSNTISLIKNKILDLAMQGKLVPQYPADEPAADMLSRINPNAKIITDNPHYPQLPDNWVLTRIKDVFEINPKNKVSDDIQAGFVPMASIHDGYSDKFHYDVKQWGEIKSGFTHFADGDIAVAKISPCLENRKSMILRDLPNGIGAGTTELIIFRSTILIPEFSLLFFKSDNFIRCCTGTFNGVVGQQRVGKSIVEDINIPIPSLNTQRAIVQRVQEWFNCLDNIHVGISN